MSGRKPWPARHDALPLIAGVEAGQERRNRQPRADEDRNAVKDVRVAVDERRWRGSHDGLCWHGVGRSTLNGRSVDVALARR